VFDHLPDSPAEAPGAGLLETHRQTQQKLEVALRWWPLWCRIIAQAQGFSWCNRSMWLIDCFAGRGLHPSNAHPDGAVAGTPVQAFRAGVMTKARFPGTEVHLRAVDVNGEYAHELERRLVRAPSDAGTSPDWRVYPKTFKAALPEILAEMKADDRHGHGSGPTMRHHDHRSLWLVDPYGVREIPHVDLDPLQHLPGAEVIINFDLGGLLRVKGAALLALDQGDPKAFFKAAIAAGNAKRLDLTWGSDRWRNDIEHADPADVLRSIAQSYADTFPAFKHRRVYPLRGSRSQKRFLIHLTHADTAADRFKSIADSCFLLDTLLSGEDLGETARANRAVALFERFRGQRTSIAELYELGVGASRRQIRNVCRSAESGGYGEYDERLDTMTWRSERLPNPTLWDLSDSD
jgi:three-Cys-motif partner protein